MRQCGQTRSDASSRPPQRWMRDRVAPRLCKVSHLSGSRRAGTPAGVACLISVSTLGVPDGFLLQIVCSPQCPSCHASRSRREAGGDTQSAQEGKPGLASFRQRRVFRAAFSGDSPPVGRQAPGSRSCLPAWELPGPPPKRRSRSQVQERIDPFVFPFGCRLRHSKRPVTPG